MNNKKTEIKKAKKGPVWEVGTFGGGTIKIKI
jgi:hypothetical protein